MNEKELSKLIQKYLAGKCTDEDRKVIDDWYESHSERRVPERVYERLTAEMSASADNTKAAIDKTIAAPKKKSPNIIQMIWRVSAAAALLTGIIIGIRYIRTQNNIASDKPLVAIVDVPAGGDKASLTLADGSVIMLNKANDGTLAKQGAINVNKSGAVLSYVNKGNGQSVVGYNTITTPRGGQFQVILPDNTKVWLNAASSIRFPVQFAATRDVTVTGEVYFEVAKDKTHPFRVAASGQQIEVLGTHFNVNAYGEKQVVKATLLEGSIMLSNSNGQQILKPGEQAEVNKENKISLSANADIEETMAWHDGLFYFKSLTIDEILGQVSRWYDVDVVYSGKMPTGTFSGKISRNTNLSEVLKILEYNGVKYHLDQRRLVIE